MQELKENFDGKVMKQTDKSLQNKPMVRAMDNTDNPLPYRANVGIALFNKSGKVWLGRRWRRKYRGQRQKWFAFLFTGDEAEINVLAPGGGAFMAEFSDWRWVDLQQVPDLIVPFKRDVYEQVVDMFSGIADNLKLDQ